MAPACNTSMQLAATSGVWQRIGTLSLGTHLCFMVAPFLGVLNGRRLFLSPPWRATTLLSLMPQRKASGSGLSCHNFSLGSSTPPLSSWIINPLSHLPRTTSTTLVPNTLTSDSISFAMSSKMALFNSSIALPTIWSLICLPKPYHLQKSSILHLNWDLPHLEGECWNIQGDDVLGSSGILSHFSCLHFFGETLLYTIYSIYPSVPHLFIYVTTCDPFIAHV